jgi:hypothetical protein
MSDSGVMQFGECFATRLILFPPIDKALLTSTQKLILDRH